MKASNKQEWDEKSVKFTLRQAHSKNIIGLCAHSATTFLTSSEDRTVRLWDMRTQSSVKLIRNACLSEELSNPASNMQSAVYVGSDRSVYEFDLRKQHIFIEDIVSTTDEPHYDSINKVKYDGLRGELLACDDEGDIRVYDTASHLKCIGRLEQEHVNICNAVEVISSDRKQFKGKRTCASGGFDGNLVIWDMDEEKPIKKVPICSILQKQGIKSQHEFIHSISAVDSSILLGLESGCVVSVPIFEAQKPKFILQASLTRVTDCKVATINNKRILLSCSIDESFAMFDYEQRVDGIPKFIQRYCTPTEPTQIEHFGNCFLLVGCTNKLGIYEIKQ